MTGLSIFNQNRAVRAMAALFFGLLLSGQLVACHASYASEPVSIEALAMQVEQNSAPLILDVRSPEEYIAGHIPGAVNIPFRDIPNQLDAIRAFNSNEVILYCERGVRAGIANKVLEEAGFTNSRQLTGHMPAWRDAKLPIVIGEQPMTIEQTIVK